MEPPGDPGAAPPPPAGDDPTVSLLPGGGEAAVPGEVRGERSYRLLAELGRGGIGTVYLAERSDGQFRQRVAIKFLRARSGPGPAGGDLVRRFKAERQILARLDHPHVAKLLDGGTSADGRPFLVMEHVEGEPIDRFCAGRELPLEARLRLFCQVCRAVQYAHANLIVHRDLKPSNILVTAAGVPKLLDFGIAKLLDPDALAITAAETVLGRQPLTPLYASPEQIRGEPVTTATDVYSLGVVLYELLTGRRPYRLRREGLPHELARAIVEEDPERPSTAMARAAAAPGAATAPAEARTTPAPDGGRRRLRGDLDSIVLKALRKRPGERFASAEQLAEDLERHLAGLPVRARRGTAAYRAQKFLRRHWVALAVTAAFVAVVAGFGLSLRRQLDLTAAERDRAQRVEGFLVDLFEVSDPEQNRGETVTARELLDRGAERVERELAGQPAAQATLLHAIGRVYHNLGLDDAAAGALDRTLELRRAAEDPPPGELAATLRDLAQAHYYQGDYERAEAEARDAVALHRRAGSPAEAVADALDVLGLIRVERGDLDGAEGPYREALAVLAAAKVGESRTLADTVANLADLDQTRGRYDAAEAGYRRALDMRLALFGDGHPDVAQTENNLASLYKDRGDYAAAEALFRRALAAERKIRGELHPEVATMLGNLAGVLRLRGDYAAAEPLQREELEEWRRLVGEDHVDYGISLLNLGLLLDARGDPAAAEPLIRRALAIFTGALGDDHPRTAAARLALGRALVALGRFAEAEPLLTAAHDRLAAALGADHPRTAAAVQALADLDLARGRAADAEAGSRRALALRRAGLPAGHPDLADSLLALADALRALGRCGEAAAPLAEAKEVLTPLAPGDRRRARAEAIAAGCAG